MNHFEPRGTNRTYLSEGGPEAARHLDACTECAREYEALQADLTDLKAVEPPRRPENYGEQVWNSIAGQLPAYADRRRPSFSADMVSAAAVDRVERRCVHAPCSSLPLFTPVASGNIAIRRPLSFLIRPVRATTRRCGGFWSDHLDRSERLLVSAEARRCRRHATGNPVARRSAQPARANRKCRQEAENAGDPALTNVLDH